MFLRELTEMLLPDGRRFPVCYVLGSDGYKLKRPGSNTVVRVDGDEVVVDLYPIVVQAAGAIDPRLLGVVEQRVDPAEAQLVVARSEGVQTVQTGVAVLDAMRIAIPALTLLVAVLIVVIAHRHTRALGIVGVAAMIAGVISLGLVWVTGATAPTAIDNGTLQEVAREVYGELTSTLVLQSLLVLGIGAIIVIGASAALRSRRGRTLAPNRSATMGGPTT